MFESGGLREIFGPKTGDEQETGGYCIVRS